MLARFLKTILQIVDKSYYFPVQAELTYLTINNEFITLKLMDISIFEKFLKMKKILSGLFLSLTLLLSSTVKAQFQPTANLTVFSEDGYKFFLILNGERQNEVAQTNIRIEELPQPYYNCKIIFDDKTQKEITKNMLMLVDANNIPQDVTYKIKKDKKGVPVLRYFSFMPAQQNMVRPGNCTVYRFGNPRQIIAGPEYVEHTTTITQNGNNGNGGLSIQMNTQGADVRVNMDDPQNGRQTTRTTTTTKTTKTTHYQVEDPYDPPARGCRNAYPMANHDFDAAQKTIQNEGFDETRTDLCRQIASSNCLSANQVAGLCKLLSFEESKLEFAKYAYEHCTDPGNYFKVSNIFSFSSSKTELNNFISGR